LFNTPRLSELSGSRSDRTFFQLFQAVSVYTLDLDVVSKQSARMVDEAVPRVRCALCGEKPL